MERYIHTILYICTALIISLAGLVELDPVMYFSASPAHYADITEHQIEEFAIDSDSVGNISSASRLRSNTCPTRSLSSRSPIRAKSQHRSVKGITLKLGKIIDCRTVIAQSLLQGLLPMATKSSNIFIIRIHKLSIEP